MADGDDKGKGVVLSPDLAETEAADFAGDDGVDSRPTTTEDRETRSLLFDLGDRLDKDEGNATELTSTGPGESLAGDKGSSAEDPEIYYGDTLGDIDEHLLSDLDISDRSVPVKIDSRYGPEDESDGPPIDLADPGGAQPSAESTRALTIFKAAEPTLIQPGRPPSTTDGPSPSSSPSLSDIVPSAPRPQLCTTEKRDLGHLEVRIGEDDVIYRWKPGSVLPYNIDVPSFPTHELMEYAAHELHRAAHDWNTVCPNAVRFARVHDTFGAAVFRLGYKSYDDPHGTLARSFFPRPPPGPPSTVSAPGPPPWPGTKSRVPNRWPLPPPPQKQDARQCSRAKRVYVYPLCFTAAHRGNMWNVFCHELGHVLGLRHEFAARNPKEQHIASVRLGPGDPDSVMEYYGKDWSRCRIGALDRAGVARFYSLTQAGSGLPICDVSPQAVMEPVVPVQQRSSW